MLLTLKDVSAELNCSLSTAKRLVSSQKLLSIRINDKCTRIHPDDLNDYIQQTREEAKQCKQLKTKAQNATNCVSVIQMEHNNNSRQKRISQRVSRKGKPT